MKKVRSFWIGLGSLRVAVVMVAVLTLIAVFYEPVRAQVNRVVGSNTFGGDGLRIASGDKDTLHVIPGRGVSIDNDSIIVTAGDGLAFSDNNLLVFTGWGTKIDNDSVVADVTEIDDYFVTLSTDQTISGKKNFTDTLGLGEPDTDGLLRIYSEEGVTDQIFVIKPNADMTQDVVIVLPADDGDANQYLKTDGSGNTSWDTPAGAGDMIKSTYDTDEDDYIDLDNGGLDTTLAAWVGLIGLNAGAKTEVDTKAELEGFITDVADFAEADGDAYSNTHDFSGATISLPTGAVDAAAEISADVIEESHLKVTGGAAVDEDIFTYESTTGDFEWHTPAELGLVTSSVIHDTVWAFDRCYDGLEFAIKQGVTDEIAIYNVVSNDSCSYFVRHISESASDNKIDTVVFTGKLPMGIDGDGVDSITYNMRTAHPVDSSSFQVKVFKRDGDELAALTLCDSVAIAATTAGAWEHKSTGALDVASADAGDEIEVWFIGMFDVGTLGEHTKPRPWYTGR